MYSGVGIGASIAASQLSIMQKAVAEPSKAMLNSKKGKIDVKRTICTHSSVGCATDATVENGVWVRQDSVFDSPIKMGALLCDHGHGDYRLRYLMKLVDGKYQRISWDQALNEITAQMKSIREKYSPDAMFFIGSSKHKNEQACLMRK